MTPQDLGQREIKLPRLYCGCKFGMTPQDFYARWDAAQMVLRKADSMY